MGKSQRTKDILVGVVAGSVLGAITALLFAPKPGKELRADIKQQAQQVGEKTAQFAGAVAEKTQEVAGTVSTTTTEWVGKAKTAASEGSSPNLCVNSLS
ncbi:YtxH domain-containing protein [Paenibacillus larvae]